MNFSKKKERKKERKKKKNKKEPEKRKKSAIDAMVGSSLPPLCFCLCFSLSCFALSFCFFWWF
jgi:hypothetical protein